MTNDFATAMRRALVKSRALDPADATSLVQEVLGANGIALPGRLDRQPTRAPLGRDTLAEFDEAVKSRRQGHQCGPLLSPDIGDGAGQRAVRGLLPHLQAALFQPGVHRGKVGKARHPL